jgi:hypothetical protein
MSYFRVSVHAKRQNRSQKFNHNGSAYAMNPPAVQVSLRRLESIFIAATDM